MRKGTLALVAALATTSAGAQTPAPAPAAPVAPAPQFDVKLSAQDGSNINQICTFAMDAPRDLATKTAVGQFCLELLNRIAQAQKASAASEAPDGGAKK